MTAPADPSEQIFTYAAPSLKFGPGASAELAHDLSALSASRVLLVTDPGVAASGGPARVASQLTSAGIETVVYDGAHVEPTDESLASAIGFARSHGDFDAFVAIGGGSSIDTAKAVNLLTSNPGELMDYVNAPVGGGVSPTQPLKPLIAIPTTTGTGAESTTVCVLDVLSQHVKTGISHARLRPTAAIIDPELTVSQPPMVTACSGLDILCHALESYTARPYTSYPAKRPDERVPYCGANPISDMWSERAMGLLADSFVRTVQDGTDRDARGSMALAATFAGMGFGNAGVHIPHANAYPIAGQVREFRPRDYPQDEAMVPHGMAVALTAPAAFRHTFSASPERHVRAARLLGAGDSDGPDLLADHLIDLYRQIDMPNGIAALGFSSPDVPQLVEGALKQQRLLSTAPMDVDESLLTEIFEESMRLW